MGVAPCFTWRPRRAGPGVPPPGGGHTHVGRGHEGALGSGRPGTTPASAGRPASPFSRWLSPRPTTRPWPLRGSTSCPSSHSIPRRDDPRPPLLSATPSRVGSMPYPRRRALPLWRGDAPGGRGDGRPRAQRCAGAAAGLAEAAL